MRLLATAPALPLHKAGPYVAAAYIVFVALILIYVAIMAVRLTRTERDLGQLKRDALSRREDASGREDAEPERDTEPVA
jgi:hypothetical protein